MAVVIGPVDAPDLHVMSFNVRRRLAVTTPVDRWSRRRALLQELLRRERPTVLGAQEVMPDQAGAILAALGDTYRFVGHGRDARRRGEATPIFYDAERLQLLAWNQRALSESPTVGGSRGWGNRVPRVVVIARWRDRATGDELRMLNAHFDPISRSSRERSGAALSRLAAAHATPTIVTGDLNTPVTSLVSRALLDEAHVSDAWTLAQERLSPEWGTFANYRPPRIGGARIDLLAVSARFEVLAAGIHGEPVLGGYPSDHLPVQARVRVIPAGG